MALSLSECLKVIDFARSQNIAETVDIIHKLHAEIKKIQFSWGTGKSVEIELCNVNYYKTSENGEDQKMYVPIPFDGLREIVAIFNSYVNGFVLLKTLCMAELLALNETKSARKYSGEGLKAKVDLSDWSEEDV
jgi:hypothetical protein